MKRLEELAQKLADAGPTVEEAREMLEDLMETAFQGGYWQGYHTDSNEIYPHDEILSFEDWLEQVDRDG